VRGYEPGQPRGCVSSAKEGQTLGGRGHYEGTLGAKSAVRTQGGKGDLGLEKREGRL